MKSQKKEEIKTISLISSLIFGLNTLGADTFAILQNTTSRLHGFLSKTVGSFCAINDIL